MHRKYSLLWLLVIGSMVCVNSYAGIQDGIVSAWIFDDELEDVVGKNDGKFEGNDAGPTYVEGVFGKAIELDGVDDYVNIEDNETLQLPDAMTVAAWINITVGKDHAGVCWKGGTSIGWGANFSWRIAALDASNVTWGRCPPDVEGWFTTDGVLPGAGQWIHVAMTVLAPDSKTPMRGYVNGVDVTDITAQTGQNEAGPFQVFEGGPVEIGVGRAIGGVAGADAFFDGMIDEVGIWDRGLTPDEIVELMDNGLGVDFSVGPRGKLAATWGRIRNE